MGNAQNRERHRSGDRPGSPGQRVVLAESAFSFEERRRRHSSTPQDEEPVILPPIERRSSDDPASGQGHHPPLQHQHSAPATVPGGAALGAAAAAAAASEPPQRVLPVVIQWKRGGRDVRLCGSFTGWKPHSMARTESGQDTEYMAIFNLPEGRHEYGFLVDGRWTIDTEAPTCEAGEGKRFNFVTVKSSDFDACNELNLDPVGGREVSGSPDTGYGQQLPMYRPRRNDPREIKTPPHLPPHLLQVILNQDTPISCEPTLLPAPNHVMLNHLYALSIKDGVMVLSATHRYRKKYVTTVLYKPIEGDESTPTPAASTAAGGK